MRCSAYLEASQWVVDREELGPREQYRSPMRCQALRHREVSWFYANASTWMRYFASIDVDVKQQAIWNAMARKKNDNVRTGEGEDEVEMRK